MQPAGAPAVRLADGWVATVVPVRISCNLKALTVEGLHNQKKDLHLAAARFVSAQLHHDLREGAAGDGLLRRRLENDRARAAHTVDEVLVKLEQGIQEVLAAHTAEPADRYFDHAVHRRMVGELLDARMHASSALALYLETPVLDVASWLRLPNSTLHREYVAFLRRTLPSREAEGGKARQQAAERLCVATGLAVATAGETDWEGLTRLMAAAADGAGPMAVELLVAAGADVNAKKADEPRGGWTALTYAAAAGDVLALQALCSAGADLEAVCSAHGSTALLVAAERGHAAAVKALAAAGGLVSAANWQGSTPLHAAAAKGHLEALQTLIRLDPEVGRVSDDGVTPLMVAAAEGHLEIVQALCKAGARADIADRSGRTAQQRAEEEKFAGVAAFLQERVKQEKAVRIDV